MHGQRVPHRAPEAAELKVRGKLCLAINVFCKNENERNLIHNSSSWKYFMKKR